MKTEDFIFCTFQGDGKKYVAEITKVQDDTFECRFVHSGKNYTFDSHSFMVLETNGLFPRGTPLTFYQLFTKGSGDLFPFCFVGVTFDDNLPYLGVLNYLVPDKSVTFLHSGNIYTFNADNVITSKTGGIYDIGRKIKKMELYQAGQEVQLVPVSSTSLSQRMAAVKSIVPTGEGEITYVDGKILGSVLISNFDINSPNLKVEFHKGLEQLSDALNSSADSKAIIIGRASQTGAESWNKPLSEQRAEIVFDYLTEVNKVDKGKVIDKIGAGSEFPLKDNRGIEEQINRSVQIFFFIPMVIPPPPPPPPPKPADVGSKEWEILISPNISVGAAIAGTFLTGKIRNKVTKEERAGAYVGGGLGASLKYMPKVGGVSDDWNSFTTNDFYTLDDFDGTLCRYTTAGAGFLIGYSVSYISFPMLGANSISVGGFELGSFGAGGSTTAGIWKFV
jgi:outer membrane protein OmpA-like peptidoglycan-associated protein